MSHTVEFKGFTDQSLKFLKALGFHQSRDWFHENKKLYEQVLKEPLGDLIEASTERYEAMGIPLKGSRKTSVFRINRDVRFSKNKDPYNTHVSAVLTRNGTKKDNSGTYMHFTPGKCLFAAGVWYPQPKELQALREAIVARRDEFLAIESELNAKGLVFTTDNTLKRVPPAFKHVEDDELRRLLRQKSFIVERALSDQEIEDPALIDTFVALASDIMPLLTFCWAAMDPARALNDG